MAMSAIIVVSQNHYVLAGKSTDHNIGMNCALKINTVPQQPSNKEFLCFPYVNLYFQGLQLPR